MTYYSAEVKQGLNETRRAAIDDYAPACSDLDLLTPKSNQHIYESKYTCGNNWVKFPSSSF